MINRFMRPEQLSEQQIRKLVRDINTTASGLVVPVSTLPPLATGPPEADIFSPRTLEDYIGQERAKDICSIIVDAAKLEKRPLPNIIVSGSFGKGKTTLARLILQRFGEPYRAVDANMVPKIEYLSGHILIDEIHNLNAESCDYLNMLIDANSVHVVGATTNPGQLPAAFRSRFRTIDLEDYTEENILVILEKTLNRKEMKFAKTALEEITKRSRNNPRHSLQILSFALEVGALSQSNSLTVATVKTALEKLDIDDDGLTALDRKYLSILSSVKPTGLTQICSMLGLQSDTIENEIEPYLLQKGMIERTSKGRLLVEKMSSEDMLQLLEQSLIAIKNRRSKAY